MTPIQRRQTLESFESYSRNLLKGSSLANEKAREDLTKQRDRFNEFGSCNLTAVEQKKYPHWVNLSNWIKESLDENSFPFEIDLTKAGKIYSRYEIDQHKPTQITAPSDKPGYVVMMAHGIPKDANPAFTRLSGQIDLLWNESFEKNSTDSIEEAKQRLRMVIGVNFCYSLESKINRLNKKYINTLPEIGDGQTHFAPFAWAPVWIKRVKEKVKNSRAVEVNAKHVKRFYQLLKKLDKAKAAAFFKKATQAKVVPMQFIREEIKNHPFTLKHIEALRQANKNRKCFVVSWDDDAIALRTEKKGLFNHYDKLIQNHPNLQVATTGYLMSDPQQEFIAFASQCDLIARRALNECAYPPEPNMIIRIEAKANEALRSISFIRTGTQKGKGLESVGLIENLKLTLSNAQGVLVFGQCGPIITAAARAEIPQHMPAKLSPKDIRNPKVLASLRKFMQSSLNPITGFAASVVRMIPSCGTQKIRGLISKIFTPFDPIEHAKFLTQWDKLYPVLTRSLIKLHQRHSNDAQYDPNYKQLAVRICDKTQTTTGKSQIANFLETKFSTLWEAKAEMEEDEKEAILTEHYDTILQKSIDVGAALHAFLVTKIA